MTPPEWRVETKNSIGSSANDGASVPLKWAHDAETGAARYIHDTEVVDERRRCLCPACQLPLTPVNAGKPQGTHPTPHFRHPEGSHKDNCMLIAARLAITRQLAEIGIIELPRRGMSRTAQGFSGQGYEIWAERPISRVRVSSARLYDHATALLTLDGGRELLVDLTGQREPGEGSHGRGIVTLSLSDPEIAQLGPEEIRARLRILPDIRWCSHWDDRQLVSEAQAAAEQSVLDNLDGWGAAEEEVFRKQLPPDLSVEGAQRLLKASARLQQRAHSQRRIEEFVIRHMHGYRAVEDPVEPPANGWPSTGEELSCKRPRSSGWVAKAAVRRPSVDSTP